MKEMQQNKLRENKGISVEKLKREIIPLKKNINLRPSINEAMELALSYLITNNIKPSMTLNEYAKFSGMSLRQVQSDAERRYLPLLKPAVSNRRELKRVNMVALYAIPFIEGFDVMGMEA
ncbi:hypothetical protein SK355_11355 [Candidatus Fukatsuia symbiotica]|uniref:Uncharacterized protein n=1 Tax=Candidatus Fukatsuia symbiotica TaxID=1878942 RepID=A0A2U8I424_9GAMM|nr:hypothetical protein [Candidatus Fukatsuia symbiotica]AWK13887.1 hypothetical protein CCS41_04415 [Candidatus Fukatsuia symbiotica]MEA9445778.1 hypothetical protein [Candidatus Fukatsuia symbiotica]